MTRFDLVTITFKNGKSVVKHNWTMSKIYDYCQSVVNDIQSIVTNLGEVTLQDLYLA
jgi:hypothetical protein